MSEQKTNITIDTMIFANPNPKHSATEIAEISEEILPASKSE